MKSIIINIYDRPVTNTKQLAIDNLPYRTRVNKRKIYYDKPASRKCKCMHISQDYHDRAKHLTTMNLHQVNYNEVKIDYYLDVKCNKVRKLKEVVRYYSKHNLVLDYKLIYHGTKTQARKKLDKLMK